MIEYLSSMHKAPGSVPRTTIVYVSGSKTYCMLGLPGKLNKTSDTSSHALPIKSEYLEGGSQASVFFFKDSFSIWGLTIVGN